MSGVPSSVPSKAMRVLVLQGGGALGAYQAGVYEALERTGFRPDWIAGVSIGAINAAIIAGNAPEKRLEAFRAFWEQVSASLPFALPFGNELIRSVVSESSAAWVAALGVKGFFRPRFPPPMLLPSGAGGSTSFYDTAPLRATLERLVDFDRINARETRLSLGAVNVHTGLLRYFDNMHQKIGPQHVMASGALPPAFPAVRIDGELYWDGGILSNTPTEAVFDDNPRQNSLIFSVHLWNPTGAEPTTMGEVFNRHKDVQYSSRIASQIVRQQQIHRLRHVINQLASRLPDGERSSPEVRELASYGCQTKMHIVRLLAPQLDRVSEPLVEERPVR